MQPSTFYSKAKLAAEWRCWLCRTPPRTRISINVTIKYSSGIVAALSVWPGLGAAKWRRNVGMAAAKHQQIIA